MSESTKHDCIQIIGCIPAVRGRCSRQEVRDRLEVGPYAPTLRVHKLDRKVEHAAILGVKDLPTTRCSTQHSDAHSQHLFPCPAFKSEAPTLICPAQGLRTSACNHVDNNNSPTDVRSWRVKYRPVARVLPDEVPADRSVEGHRLAARATHPSDARQLDNRQTADTDCISSTD